MDIKYKVASIFEYLMSAEAYQSQFQHIPTREFLKQVLRYGVAKSNLYQVKFDFIKKDSQVAQILQRIGFISDSVYSTKNKMELLCSSASLPGATVKKSSIQSAYPGYDLEIPIGGMNHEFVLTFYMDKEMLPYKFFHGWLRAINPRIYNSNQRPVITRSRFYEEIVQDFYIYKFPDIHSKGIGDRGIVNNNLTMKPTEGLVSTTIDKNNSGTTDLFVRAIDCYPVNVGSVTQSYEQTSLLSFTVNLSARDMEISPPTSFLLPNELPSSRLISTNSNESNFRVSPLDIKSPILPGNSLFVSGDSSLLTSTGNFSNNSVPSFSLPII